MRPEVVLIITLLLLVVAGERANYVLARKIAAKHDIEHLGICPAIMDGCPMAKYCPGKRSEPSGPSANASPVAVVAAAKTNPTVSGFSDTPDFMAHAREMDARKFRSADNTPAKKAENLMMQQDQAQRKMRAALLRGQ
jgi:hypothetical protein